MLELWATDSHAGAVWHATWSTRRNTQALLWQRFIFRMNRFLSLEMLFSSCLKREQTGSVKMKCLSNNMKKSWKCLIKDFADVERPLLSQCKHTRPVLPSRQLPVLNRPVGFCKAVKFVSKTNEGFCLLWFYWLTKSQICRSQYLKSRHSLMSIGSEWEPWRSTQQTDNQYMRANVYSLATVDSSCCIFK